MMSHDCRVKEREPGREARKVAAYQRLPQFVPHFLIDTA